MTLFHASKELKANFRWCNPDQPAGHAGRLPSGPQPGSSGAWRHLLRHVSLAYEPGMWSIVFPVGMYGVASREPGTTLYVSWLVTGAGDEGWLALGGGLGRRGDGDGASASTSMRRLPVGQ